MILLLAGQEYSQRKARKGAYWEDRYHPTAVESGEHLALCMVYIDTNKVHEEEWPGGIAVGNRPFVERLKELLGFRAKGRKVTDTKEGYQFRESPSHYNVVLGAENEDIGTKNTCFWDINL